MEYAPPEFQFTGLQFNPANFDNPLLTTSSGGVVPDPLVIGEIDTNLIKATSPSLLVSLYENALNAVNLGWSSLNELNLSSYLMYFRSNAMYFQNFTDDCKFVIDATLDNLGLIFYPNTSITGFQAGSIRVTNISAPSADDLGTIQITGATLKTPLNIISNTLSSALNLFTTQTGNITLGGFSVTNILNLQAKSIQIASSLITGLIDLSAKTININNGTGNATYIGSLSLNAGTIATNGVTDIFLSPTNIAGKIKLSGGQDLEPSNVAKNMLIGNDITSANLLLGNSTYPPSCLATATTANHITNYSTVSSLISNAFTGAVSINPTGSGNTNINATSNTGTVSIGNSASTTTMLGIVNIGNSGTSTITVGNSGTLINVGYPLTPIYTYNATTGANIVGAIGYIYVGTYTGGVGGAGATPWALGTLTLPVGVFYLSANITYRIQTTPTSGTGYVTAYISDAGGTRYAYSRIPSPAPLVDANYSTNISAVISITTASTVLTTWCALQWTTGLMNKIGTDYRFTATRIA